MYYVLTVRYGRAHIYYPGSYPDSTACTCTLPYIGEGLHTHAYQVGAPTALCNNSRAASGLA